MAKTDNSLIVLIVVLSLLSSVFCAAGAEEQAGLVRVSYLGPEGTYTQEAAQFFFTDGETLIPSETVGLAIGIRCHSSGEYSRRACCQLPGRAYLR